MQTGLAWPPIVLSMLSRGRVVENGGNVSDKGTYGIKVATGTVGRMLTVTESQVLTSHPAGW
jgi:hypothetical protein